MGLNAHMIPFEEYIQMDRFFKIEDTIPDDSRLEHRNVQTVYGNTKEHIVSVRSGSETAAWQLILERYAECHRGRKKIGTVPWKIVTFVCDPCIHENLLKNIGSFGLDVASEYNIDLIASYVTFDEVSVVRPLYTKEVKVCNYPVVRIILSYTDHDTGKTLPFPKPWPEKSYYIWRKFRNLVAYLPEHFEQSVNRELKDDV